MCWMKWAWPELNLQANVWVLVCVCVCAALNKWPMTHNKNYYEWTRTRKTHWAASSLCSLRPWPWAHMNWEFWECECGCGCGCERENVSNDCLLAEWFTPFGSSTLLSLLNCIGCQSHGTCIKIQLRAIEQNIKKLIFYRTHTHLYIYSQTSYIDIFKTINEKWISFDHN